VVTGSGTQTAGGAQTVTITAKDANGNTVTGYAGAKNLTFSGANVATTGENPTAANDGASDINFGSTTALTFISGVVTSSVKLYKAETAVLAVTDGSISATGGNRLSVLVSAATETQLVLTRSGTQTAG